MNIFAGFLKTLSPLPLQTGFQPQDGSSATVQASDEKGFESVLSALAQNSAAASQGTTVAPHQRSATRTAGGDNGSGGEAQDSGSDANPDPNSNSNAIIKTALTALQNANGTAPASDGDPSANGNASPLSMLSLVLLGGTESAGQGSSIPNGQADENALLGAADQQIGTNPNASSGASPNQNASSQLFSAQQKALASSQASGTVIGSTSPNGAPMGLAQAAATSGQTTTTTQSAGASGVGVGSDASANAVVNGASAGSDTQNAAPTTEGGPASGVVPAPVGVVPLIAAATTTDASAGSDSSETTSANFGATSNKAQGQDDHSSAQASSDADPSAAASNPQPAPVLAPDATVMAANAGIAASVAVAVNLQANTPTQPSSPSNGQNGARTGSTDRASASAKQQKPVDQSTTPDDSGGSNGAVDVTAQAALVSQVAPVSFEAATATDSQATQSQTSLQAQISNPVFTAPSASDASDSLPPLSADVESDIKVTVLSTETHFAPPQRLSPIQQIANAMAGALPPLSANPVAGAASDSTSDSSASQSADAAGSSSAASVVSTNLDTSGQSAGPVKVLNLQLEPPSLGSVTISLNLSAGSLTVQVAASQASTVSLIERDKNSLSDQLRDSGYSIAGVAVTLSPHQGMAIANDGAAAQGQAGQSLSQNNGQAMSSDGGSSNANDNGQNGGNRSFSEPTGGTPDSFTGAVGGGASSGDLYI